MQTLETMAILARMGSSEPDLTRLVANVVRGGGDPSYFVSSIDSWCRQNFIYRGERDEVLRTVPFMLKDLATIGKCQGDCDDMCIMSSAMLRACGLLVRMTAIQAESPAEFDHVFSEARIGWDWVPVDPTVPFGTPYQMFGFMSEVV